MNSRASLSITNSWSPPKPMSIELVMPPNHLILCHPLLPPSIFPSIRVYSNESAFNIRWTKYCTFSFNISPSNEHPGLIFRMDWLDPLTVQGTLRNLLQHTYHYQHIQFSSVQFSRSVVSDSLRPHESQYARPPCPSPTPGVHSDSRPLSQ